MVRRSLAGCCAVLIAVSVVGVALQAPAHASSVGAIVEAVNQHRVERGLPPLGSYGDATMAVHANDLLVSTGEYHGDRATVTSWYFDRGADSFRENQAVFPAGQASASQVIAAWRASEQHAANLDAPDATHIAAAVRTSGGRTYFTVHLLGHGSTPPPDAPPPSGEPDPPPPPAPEPDPEPQPEPEPEPAPEPDPEPDPEPEPDAEPAPDPEPEAPTRDLSALRAPVPDRSPTRVHRPDGGGDEPHRRPVADLQGDVEVAPQILTAPDAADPGEGGDPALEEVDAEAAASADGRDPSTLWGLLPAAMALGLLAMRGWRRHRRRWQPR